MSSSSPEKTAPQRPLPSWDDVDLEVAYKFPDHSVFLKERLVTLPFKDGATDEV